MDAKFLSFKFPGIDNVYCAFQMRSERHEDNPYSGGNISFDVGDDPKSVARFRKALRKKLGFSHWLEMKQVHGDAVVFDPEGGGIGEPGEIEADGQATNRPGHALVVKTADCQPILVAHAEGGHVLAVHAGWRGNVAGLPAKAVTEFCQHYGLSPESCMAVRGPSLSPSVSEFKNFAAEFGEEFSSYYDQETMTVDLWRLTRDQLMSAGLPESHIFGLDICTYSNPGLLYSYRRRKISGRQASLIWVSE